MQATLFGRVDRPGIAVIGTWEPFIPSHRALIERMAVTARERGLASIVVLLDPSPSVFLWGRNDWPIYDDVWMRNDLIFQCGVDAILHTHMSKADVNAGAAEFFDYLKANVPLAELWLGVYQTLGSGLHGRIAVVDELGAQHGIHIERLPPLRLETEDVRKLLAAGRVQDAIRVVGRHPIRRRPRSNTIRLAWSPGRYEVVPAESPAAGPCDSPFYVELAQNGKRLPSFEWPDRAVRYLAFTAGPGDLGADIAAS